MQNEENITTEESKKAIQYHVELRDWFAGQALAGIMTDGAYGEDDCIAVAMLAYSFADAMLKEREI